jgi:hypothetical protein
MDHWKAASGEAYSQVKDIEKVIKKYSYRDEASSHRTDELISRFLIDSLFISKKLLYSISDLLFSLHLADDILDKIQDLRDEIDHVSNHIKIRNYKWKNIPHVFLVRIINHDHELLERAKKLNIDIEILFNGILTEAKKSRKGRLPEEKFWGSVRDSIRILSEELRELDIIFKEREALCDIHHLTLEKTYREAQKIIREMS